ncbi:hypothetical protein [Massilia frigida]
MRIHTGSQADAAAASVQLTVMG